MKILTQFINTIIQLFNPIDNIKSIKNVKEDIFSGITVAVIALPLALAFGEISGLGPFAGIIGAICGGLIGGLFGGSMVSVSGPTAPTSSQIAVFMGAYLIGTSSFPDFVAIFSIIFLSGIIMIIAASLNISKYIQYIPYSVVSGFMCGIGIIVILSQLKNFFGTKQYNLSDINYDILIVSIPTFIILFLWPLIKKNFNYINKIPSPLIALIIGTSISYLFNLEIPLIGDKMQNTNESHIFNFYIPDFERFIEFLNPAFSLALLVIIDSLLTCIIGDNLTGIRHTSNKETFGQGLANMLSGLLGGTPTATATMFTVSNIKSGASSSLSSIVYALTLLAILLGFSFIVEMIPLACIAAILLKVGFDILDYRILPIMRKLPISDLFIFITVLFITVFYDLILAVGVGVLIAIVQSADSIKRYIKSKHKHQFISIEEYKLNLKKYKNESINIFRLEGPIFFASMKLLVKSYTDHQKKDILVIDMNNITRIDLSGTYALEDLIKGAQINNTLVYVINENSKIDKVLKNVNFIKHIGEKFYFKSKKLLEENLNRD
tara:strand:+ start:3676 stop:5325 length:1650 start_codon:yes stop_codon:yes gene_type:complete